MTIRAVWGIGIKGERREMAVATPEDVDTLLTILTDPDTTVCFLDHQKHGEGMEVTIGVFEGYGYMAYCDPNDAYVILDGDPASPAYYGELPDFRAGSGVSVDVLTGAVKQFLASGERPTSVAWQEL